MHYQEFKVFQVFLRKNKVALNVYTVLIAKS